jgi:hypothetical protein
MAPASVRSISVSVERWANAELQDGRIAEAI